MINYSLPKALEIDGVNYAIRYNWTAVLDIISCYDDVDLTPLDKAIITLRIMYRDKIPENAQEALNKAIWFIDGGETSKGKNTGGRLMDWEQDFSLIIPEINHIAGREVRAEPDLHWWTFLGYYHAIGDCTFASVVSLRRKINAGKKLEKYERDFYRTNHDIIDLKPRYTQAEKEILREIVGAR